MIAKSKELFTCDVCEKTFSTAGRLSAHVKRTNAHDGMRRNAMNEILFACSVCSKEYGSEKKLYNHRYYAKHTLPDSMSEPVVDKTEWMETPTVVDENIYSSDGQIRNKISHETERVIELSTSLALGNVQDAVKRAFRSVHEEIIPLYVTASVERMDAWERVCKVLAPFENELIITVMRDTFKAAEKLKTDLMNL